MNFDVLFALLRYPVLAGCLVLALSWHSSAIAENTFSGPFPTGVCASPMCSILRKRKTSLYAMPRFSRCS